MLRIGPTTPAPIPRHREQARRVCAGALATAGVLYFASPYMALWSMKTALQSHDDNALRASLDWKLVRDGLKDGLGLRPAVQQVSQPDDLPGFGESFATNVASGMIDDEITPERLDSIISGPALSGHDMAGRPHGFFMGPLRFQAEIHMPGEQAPIQITMRIKKWHWKVTRITLPDDMLAPPPTHVASTRS